MLNTGHDSNKSKLHAKQTLYCPTNAHVEFIKTN